MSAEEDKYQYKHIPGPWNSEPDRLEFEEHGLPCLMRRGPLGAWCGYVAVPLGHPYYGKEGRDLDVHGGVTFMGTCQGDICHTPKEGAPDNVWWFGFDCAHAWDLVPWFVAQEQRDKWPALAVDELGQTIYVTSPFAELAELKDKHHLFAQDTYRDVDYVKGQCKELAEQLAEMSR